MSQTYIPVPPDSKSSKVLIISLSILVIVVSSVAGYLVVKSNKAEDEIASLNGQVASLTAQLEDSQKEISELKPLAIKARTMPISLRIDRHALNSGFNLYVFNQARTSLRFHYTVNGNEVRNSKATHPVIDGGRFSIIPGLASGDVVKIDCEGYDDRTVTIQ